MQLLKLTNTLSTVARKADRQELRVYGWLIYKVSQICEGPGASRFVA